MASSTSTISESRTSDFAVASDAMRLPTAAGQAARASSSVEMASEIFNLARDLPARSMRTNSILAPRVQHVAQTSMRAECFDVQGRDGTHVPEVSGCEN